MNRGSNGRRTESAERQRRQRILVLTLVALIVVAVLPGAAKSLFSSADSTMPPELIGTWVTSDPRYADRALIITATTISFYVGDAEVTTHPIRRVAVDHESRATVYELEYESGDEVLSLVFTFIRMDGGIIRLANQEHMDWKKAGSN